MTLQEIVDESVKKMEGFDVRGCLPALRYCNEGALNDVLNVNGCRYYQWLPHLIETIKPKQIVELGGAMGVSAIMMLQSKYQDFKLYSVTLPENGLEFSFIKDSYPNFYPIVGDDLDFHNMWYTGKNVIGVNDFYNTDLWFFDSLHTYDQLSQELKLYGKSFKKGTILLFDDIRMNEIWPIWKDLPYEKIEMTNPMHYSGYGIARV